MTKQLVFKFALSLLLGAMGQTCMKWGMMAHKARHGEIEGLMPLLTAMTQPGVIIGLGCFVFSSMLYLVLLSKLPLSVLYPMVALNYVIISILGRYIFHEQTNPLRIAGVFVIICGVMMVSASNSAPASAVPGAETPRVSSK